MTLRIFLNGGGSFDLTHVEKYSYSRDSDGLIRNLNVHQSGGVLRLLGEATKEEEKKLIGPVAAILQVIQ